MRKLRTMTNKEFVAKHYPENIIPYDIGGVAGCPRNYGLELQKSCRPDHEWYWDSKCKDCYNKPAKYRGKYIMRVVQV